MKAPSLDFDRWDYGATRVLLVGVLVAAPLFVVAVTSPEVRSGARAVWAGAAVITVAHASVTLQVLTLLPSLVIAAAAALTGGCLLGLVRPIQQGASFSDSAVTRLRIVGLTLVIAPWLHQAAAGFADAAVLERAFGTQPSFSIFIGGSTLAVSGIGLAVGAVAEAFRQGTRLRDDVDGLV